ncbi:MAG: helix-turn-helix transcriptional regulator [Bacteroidota bacterium]
MDNKVFLLKLGQRISKLRKERNITQIELSHRCDFDRSNLRRIESGRTNPTSLTLKRIAEGLEITVDELLKFEEKKKS